MIQAAPAARIAAQTLPLAKGSPPGNAILLFGHFWPFMVLPYLGPIKTYLLAASFAIFGVSVAVMRATTVICGLIGVIFLYGFAREVFNRITAEFVVLLVGLDTSYLLFSRDDWGPIAIGFAAKTCGLFLLARWWHRPHSKVAPLLAGLALGIGMSHKADFAWLLLAGIPISLIVYSAHRRVLSVGCALILLGFIVGSAPLLYYNAESGWLTWTAPGDSLIQTLATGSSPVSFARALVHLFLNNVSQRWAVMALVLDGRGVADYIVGSAPSYVSIILDRLQLTPGYASTDLSAEIARVKLTAEGLLFALSISAIGAYTLSQRSLGQSRPVVACLLATVLIFGQIVITPAATGPHHSIAIYPFPQLVVAYGLSLIVQSSPRLTGHLAKSIYLIRRPLWQHFVKAFGFLVTGALLLTVLGCDVGQLVSFEKRLVQTGGHGYWSDAVDNASAYIQTHYPGQYVETLDWGIRDQLIVLSGGRSAVGFWGPDANAHAELNAELAAGHHLFILHTSDWTLFKPARAQFIGQLSDPGLGPVQIHQFAGSATTPSVVLVEVPERTAFRLLPQLARAAIRGPLGDVPPISVQPLTINGVEHEALLAHPQSSITFGAIEIPEGSRLVFATGISPACMAASAGAIYQVDIRSRNGNVTVFSRTMQPKIHAADRRWLDGSVNLDNWANQVVDISLITEAVRDNYTCAWAVWGDPMVSGYKGE